MIIPLILGLLLGAVSVIFILQNITETTVTFLTWQIHGSLALIILVALLVGICISLLLYIPDAVRKSVMASRLKKRNQQLEDEAVKQKQEISALTTKITEIRTTSSSQNNPSSTSSK